MKKTMLSIGLVLGIALIGVGIALLVTHEGKAENQEETPIISEKNPVETASNTTPIKIGNETVSINSTAFNQTGMDPVSGNQTLESYFISDTEAP